MFSLKRVFELELRVTVPFFGINEWILIVMLSENSSTFITPFLEASLIPPIF